MIKSAILQSSMYLLLYVCSIELIICREIAYNASQEIITKYHKHLATDQAEEGVPLYWVAVRVGMRRIYWCKLLISK
jgi:hypothetical protein